MMKKDGKEEFPGYKHYAESEDITSQDTRAELDVENISRANKNPAEGVKPAMPDEQTVDYSPEIVPGTEADVTVDDLQALGPVDGDLDGGEDETLLPLVKIGPDITGDDLDVPGAELDEEDEMRGLEDEENRHYSRGQD